MSKLEITLDKIKVDLMNAFSTVDIEDIYVFKNVTDFKHFPNILVLFAEADFTNRTFGSQYDLTLPINIYVNVKNKNAQAGYENSIHYIGEILDNINEINSSVDYEIKQTVLNQRFIENNPSILTSALQVDALVNYNKCKTVLVKQELKM